MGLIKSIVVSVVILVIALVVVQYIFNPYSFGSLKTSLTDAVSGIANSAQSIAVKAAVGSQANKSLLYITEKNNDTIALLDVQYNKIVGFINLGGKSPNDAVLSRDGQLYVAESYYNYHTPQYHGVVSAISTINDTVTSTIFMNATPLHIIESVNGSYLYTTNNNGTISTIDLQTQNVTNTIGIGNSQPQGIAISPDGKSLYALVVYTVPAQQESPLQPLTCEPYYSNDQSNYGAGSCYYQRLYRLDLSDHQPDQGIAIGNTTSFYLSSFPSTFKRMVFAPNNKLYVLNTFSPGIEVVNTSDNHIEENLSMGVWWSEEEVSNEGIAISPGGAYVYAYVASALSMASESGGTHISVINTTTDSVVDNMTLGGTADDIAVEANFTYLTGIATGILSRVNDSAVGSFSLSGCPCEFASVNPT